MHHASRIDLRWLLKRLGSENVTSLLVEGGDATAAEATHRELVSTIDKAVKRGAMHKNTGARKKSRAARTLVRSAGE